MRRIILSLHETTTGTHCGRCGYRALGTCEIFGKLYARGEYERHADCIDAETRSGPEVSDA